MVYGPSNWRGRKKVLLAKVAKGDDPIADRDRLSLTVGQLCDRCLAEGLTTAKDSSVRQARANIENHIKPLVGKTLATKLNRAELN
jgi:hypothetical protein